MIYKFKRWIYVPAYTEVYVTADTDKEALETMNSLDPKSLSYKECPITALRTTYEVVKVVDDNKPRT